MSVLSGKQKPISVLWLTSSYPRYYDDSASVFLRYLAESLAERSISLCILAPDHTDVQTFIQQNNIVIRHFRYFWPRKLQKLAYGSGILPNLRSSPWLIVQIPMFILSMLSTAFGILRAVRPALIHAHWVFPQGTVAVLLGKFFKLPVVVTAHGGDAFALRGNLLGAIKRWTVKSCDAWTSNTNATAAAIGANLPPPYIIPMGIDYLKFAAGNALHARLDSAPRKCILLFVGRLVEKKGAAVLLQAFAKLPQELREQSECWIVGDGVERKRLKALADDLQVAEQVIFHGKVANSLLPQYYATADLFIAPSITDAKGDTEGQGVILLEAMASGTAVISTRTGGIAEVIEHGNTGWLVEPNNSTQLASAITELMKDEQTRIRLVERGSALARSFDWKLQAQKMADLYASLIPDAVQSVKA